MGREGSMALHPSFPTPHTPTRHPCWELMCPRHLKTYLLGVSYRQHHAQPWTIFPAPCPLLPFRCIFYAAFYQGPSGSIALRHCPLKTRGALLPMTGKWDHPHDPVLSSPETPGVTASDPQGVCLATLPVSPGMALAF